MNIDHGVAIPINTRARVYPFPTMKLGDSFVVPKSERKRATVAASAYKSQHDGWNYTVRTVGEETRIWRTA